MTHFFPLHVHQSDITRKITGEQEVIAVTASGRWRGGYIRVPIVLSSFIIVL
jgi:hypothetical protein